MDKLYILGRIVPAPKFTGTIGLPSFKWIDPRPYPTPEQFQLEWNKIQVEESNKRNNESAKSAYEDTLNTPIEYKGHSYLCDEEFTVDMTRLLALHGLTPFNEVKLLDTHSKVVTLTINEFKELVTIVGSTHYAALTTYWAKLK